MNRFEAAYLAHLAAPHSTTDELTWAQRLASEPSKWLAEFHDKGDDLSARGDAQSIFTNESIQDSADVLGFRLPLLVNVNLDDDTLKTCFSIWLTGIRASLYPAPKAFEDRDLKHWKKFGLLPAFDLQLWNRLTGAGYTDAFDRAGDLARCRLGGGKVCRSFRTLSEGHKTAHRVRVFGDAGRSIRIAVRAESDSNGRRQEGSAGMKSKRLRSGFKSSS